MAPADALDVVSDLISPWLSRQLPAGVSFSLSRIEDADDFGLGLVLTLRSPSDHDQSLEDLADDVEPDICAKFGLQPLEGYGEWAATMDGMQEVDLWFTPAARSMQWQRLLSRN